MEKEINGIMRAREYAPHGGYERDHATFMAVVEALRRRGWKVNVLCEADFCSALNNPKTLKPYNPKTPTFSLARDPRSIALMERLEGMGARFINSASAIRAATRARSVMLMREAGIPMPDTVVLSLDGDVPAWSGSLPVWVKRGDGCTQGEQDIVLCHTAAQVGEALAALQRSGVKEAVVSSHAEGQLVKFYGVTGTTFFAAFSGGKPCTVPGLEDMARRAAACHKLEVWGGDCIVTPGRGPLVIDFNDWPSFAACRTEAAEAIAARIDVWA